MFSLFQGLLVALVISTPTGPVGFLTIRRTLVYGLAAGIITGMGAIASDLVYSSVVVFGLSSVQHFFMHNQNFIKIFGSLLLISMGFFTYFSKTKYEKDLKIKDPNTLVGHFFTAFLVTMTNPIQLVTFGILFGSIGVRHQHHFQPALFLTGLLIGALFWWCSLSYVVYRLRHKFDQKHIVTLNKIAGLVIGISGFLVLINTIFHHFSRLYK